MKILVDQNISFRLLLRIKSAFPDAFHVRDLGLIDFDDFKIFKHTRQNGFYAILTLDEDFSNIQIEHGVPPKIIRMRTGNCLTATLANIILNNAELIKNFLSDAKHDCLEIFR